MSFLLQGVWGALTLLRIWATDLLSRNTVISTLAQQALKKHQKAAEQRAISARAGSQPESRNCCFSHSLKGTKTTSTQPISLPLLLPRGRCSPLPGLDQLQHQLPLATSSAKEVGERRKPCPTAEGHGQGLGMPLVLRLPLCPLLKSRSRSGTLLLEGGR